ncbi:hypothetical protein CEXT_242631, partial [Caerostris extrusa]
ATSPKPLFPEESRQFYGGVEWRLCGFVWDVGNAVSKGSVGGFQLDVYRS